MNTNTVKFKTRLSKGAEPVETVADLDYDGVTDVQLRELAERSIIITIQAQYRAAGKVPETDVVSVAQLLAKERKAKNTPEALAAKIKALPDDVRASLLRELAESIPNR